MTVSVSNIRETALLGDIPSCRVLLWYYRREGETLLAQGVIDAAQAVADDVAGESASRAAVNLLADYGRTFGDSAVFRAAAESAVVQIESSYNRALEYEEWTTLANGLMSEPIYFQ